MKKCLLYLALVGTVALVGCFGTATPKTVTAKQASFDQGVQNSGFLGWTNAPTPHSAILSQTAITRYNALAVKWGGSFIPTVKPWDGVTMILQGKTSTNYILDAEHLVDFMQMSDFQRAAFKP